MSFQLITPPIPNIYRELTIQEWINSNPKNADFKIGHILQIMFTQLLNFIHTLDNIKLACNEEVLWTNFCNFVYVNRYNKNDINKESIYLLNF
jgi:hypothetical protein